MSPEQERIVKEALELPAEARAALAGILLDSLNGQQDPDAERAWREEIRRRIGQLDADPARTVSWDQVRERLSD